MESTTTKDGGKSSEYTEWRPEGSQDAVFRLEAAKAKSTEARLAWMREWFLWLRPDVGNQDIDKLFFGRDEGGCRLASKQGKLKVSMKRFDWMADKVIWYTFFTTYFKESVIPGFPWDNAMPKDRDTNPQAKVYEDWRLAKGLPMSEAYREGEVTGLAAALGNVALKESAWADKEAKTTVGDPESSRAFVPGVSAHLEMAVNSVEMKPPHREAELEIWKSYAPHADIGENPFPRPFAVALPDWVGSLCDSPLINEEILVAVNDRPILDRTHVGICWTAQVVSVEIVGVLPWNYNAFQIRGKVIEVWKMVLCWALQIYKRQPVDIDTWFMAEEKDINLPLKISGDLEHKMLQQYENDTLTYEGTQKAGAKAFKARGIATELAYWTITQCDEDAEDILLQGLSFAQDHDEVLSTEHRAFIFAMEWMKLVFDYDTPEEKWANAKRLIAQFA